MFKSFTHMISNNPTITHFLSPTHILPLPPSLTPLVTASLFSRSVSVLFFLAALPLRHVGS